MSSFVDFVKELFCLAPEDTKLVGLVEFKRKKIVSNKIRKPIEKETSLSGLRRRKPLN